MIILEFLLQNKWTFWDKNDQKIFSIHQYSK